MTTIKELHSFKISDAVKFHNELNPKLWNEDHSLKPVIRQHLLTIAEDFISELGIDDLHVEDIRISGSNAAYSYTSHSDIDLHILVDMSKLSDEEVYQELFNSKKTIYNDSHDITIKGIPVELYVQDTNQPVVSLGEYSLINDDWIKEPIKRRANLDQAATKHKFDKLSALIQLALKNKHIEKVNKLIDTIRRYRSAGLEKNGEFGPENLVYKALRSQGLIDKLYDLRDKLHSKELSIVENVESALNDDSNQTNKITLNQLYHQEYPDDNEIIWNFVGSGDFDIPFEIKTISPDKLEILLRSRYKVKHIDDLFGMMNKQQKRIIKNYEKDPLLSQQLIICSGGIIIDGNHRALAAVLTNRSIKYIDVAESESE